MDSNEFKVIAYGTDTQWIEDIPKAHEFKTEVWVVRFSPNAKHEWDASRPVDRNVRQRFYPDLYDAEKDLLERKQLRENLVDRLKETLRISGYAEVTHTINEIFTVVCTTPVEADTTIDPKLIVHRVNPMTLTDFMHYLRDHGWPVSPDKAKGMIEAGIFEPAAIAFKKEKYGETTIDYAIIPKRLDKWFEENADEVRIYNEHP